MEVQSENNGMYISLSRRVESVQCWELLDEACARGVREAPPGSMREIIAKAVQTLKETSKSITLGEMFDLYTEKVKRTNRTKGHLANIGYARKAFDFWIDTKLPEITPGNIEFALQKFSSAERSLVALASGPQPRRPKGTPQQKPGTAS